MFRLVAFLTVSLCIGLSAAQAPAPGPSAGNATSLASQFAASPVFAYLKCDDALDAVYTAYQSTKSFAKVPAIPFNTSLYYVYCNTIDTTGNAKLVFHPTLTLGLAASQYTASPLLPAALNAISAAANAVLADDELLYASYPWSTGGKSPASYTKNVLGLVVEGLGTDLGTDFVCGCGVSTTATA